MGHARNQVLDFEANNPTGVIALWTFANGNIVAQTNGFVSPADALIALDSAPGCSGDTNLADALCFAMDTMVAATQSGQPRLLTLLTDGVENASVGPCSGPDSASPDVPYSPGSWHAAVYDTAVTNNINVSTDFYGPTVQRSQDIETGALLRGGGPTDVDFFQALASATGGTFTFFGDDSLGSAVPTLSEWGLIAFVSLLAMLAVFYSRKRRLAI